MGILRRIGIAIGIIIGSFIVLFLAIPIIEQIVTFNEKVEAAYNSSYQQAYDPIYHARYQEGYEEQYSIGYNEQYDVAYNKQYNAAYNEHYNTRAYDEGYQGGLEIGYKQGLATQVDLRNPTYKELIDFLRRDRTDSKRFIKGEYECVDFSAEVNNNAELEGIRSAFVGIYFPQPPGHAIVAFETIDKGLIFIAPQSDARVKLVIGKRYYQCVEPKPGYYYEKPSYDDTIVETQVIW